MTKARRSALDKAVDELSKDVLQVPWGSMAKSELEFLVFRLLVEKNDIKLLTMTDTALAVQLKITPARVRALRYKWEQRTRSELTTAKMLDAIVAHEVRGADDDRLVLRVDSIYVLDRLVDELRSGERPVLVRSTRTPGHVEVDIIDFWIKANQLAGVSGEALNSLQTKLLEAFPDRKLKKLSATSTAFITKAAGLANIAEFLNTVFVAKTPTG